MLAANTWGPEFRSLIPVEKLGVDTHGCNLGAVMGDRDGGIAGASWLPG